MSLTSRKLALILWLVVGGSTLETPASAALEPSYTFVQTGYSEGAIVTGAFSGSDLDNNGILVHFPLQSGLPIDTLELTSFSMQFSGNSLSDPFDLALADLLGFVFEINSSGIGDDPAFDPTIGGNLVEGIGAIGTNHFYTSGLGPNGFIGGYVGGQIDLSNLGSLADNALDSSENLVLVTQVPEPTATASLIAAGVISAVVRVGRMRRR